MMKEARRLLEKNKFRKKRSGYDEFYKTYHIRITFDGFTSEVFMDAWCKDDAISKARFQIQFNFDVLSIEEVSTKGGDR